MKSGQKNWASPKVVAVFRKLIGKDPAGASAVPMHTEPATPLPRVDPKRDPWEQCAKAAIVIRGQQGAQSEVIGKLERGDGSTGQSLWRRRALVHGEN